MKSHIIGSTTTAPSTTAVNYNTVVSDNTGSWSTTEVTRACIAPHAMVIDQLRAMVTTAPAAGKSYALCLMVNGVASALVATISDTQITANDSGHKVSVAAGDLLSIRCTPTGTPTGSGAMYWTMRAEATTAFALMSQNQGTPTAIGTNFQAPQNKSNISSTDALAQIVVPTAGTISNLYLYGRTGPNVGSTVTVTVIKNGVATALTTSMTGNATTTQSHDSAHSVSVVAGDTISLQYDISGAVASSTTNSFGLTFTPTTDGESFWCYTGNGNSPSTSATAYMEAHGDAATWTSTESAKWSRLGATTIKAMYVQTSVSPGVSPKAYALTLRNNSASTAATVTINDASTTVGSTRNGSITGLTIDIADDDKAGIQSVPTSTPVGLFIKTSLLMYIDPTEPNLIQAIGSITGAAVTFLNQPTVGSTVIVAVSQNSPIASNAVTDNQGNAYTQIADQATPTTGDHVSLFYAKNIASSGAFTITGPSGACTFAYEFGNVSTASPLEVSNVANGSSGSPSTSLTTTNNRDIYLVAEVDAVNAALYTPGAAYSMLDNQLDTATHERLAVEMRKTALGTITGNMTLGSTGEWGVIMIALRKVAPASPGFPFQNKLNRNTLIRR